MQHLFFEEGKICACFPTLILFQSLFLKEAKDGKIKELETPSSKETEQHKLIQIYMAGAIIHVYFMPSKEVTITES